MLTLLLIDAITLPPLNNSLVFGSAVLQQLLGTAEAPKDLRHHVWISYIHEVVVPHLREGSGRAEEENYWVTVCILLQA